MFKINSLKIIRRSLVSIHKTYFRMESTFEKSNKNELCHQIALTQTEKEIFEIFIDFLKEKQLKTTIRVVGGWVRDKVFI